MNKISVALAALALSACGFHLKGSMPYDQLPEVSWHVVGGELQQPLESALDRAKGRLVAESEAKAVLRVLSYDTKRDVYTVSRAATLNEYLLTLHLTAQAYRNGQPWGTPMVVQVQRTLSYADSAILGKQSEEATIWREMREDAAEQLVRRLTVLKVQ